MATVVRLFDSTQEALDAVQRLRSLGIPESEISVAMQSSEPGGSEPEVDSHGTNQGNDTSKGVLITSHVPDGQATAAQEELNRAKTPQLQEKPATAEPDVTLSPTGQAATDSDMPATATAGALAGAGAMGGAAVGGPAGGLAGQITRAAIASEKESIEDT